MTHWLMISDGCALLAAGVGELAIRPVPVRVCVVLWVYGVRVAHC